MQCPRRTAELCVDEPASSVKRSSGRPTQRLVAPSPANAKYSTRPSRLPGPTRVSSSSIDRQRPSTTPHRTPLKPTPMKRDDKKWISEQVERITDYLNGAALRGEINSEVTSHSLRQMTIKNFIAIVNHFLHIIGGNRLKLSTNYVEELMEMLPKLEYPHAINRSWLKTPNTSHGFSNVLLLFDFFMEFMPNSQSGAARFDVQQETTVTNTSNVLNQTQLLDGETQRQLLQHAQQGFPLWDKQQTQEYEKQLLQSCNLLIQKRCDLPNVESLQRNIEQLRLKLQTVQKKKPRQSKDNETRCTQLCKEVRELQQQLQQHTDTAEIESNEAQSCSHRLNVLQQEIKALQASIQQMRQQVSAQQITVIERNNMISKLDELQHTLHCEERSLQQVQKRSDSQTIRLKRSKKQLNDKIEKFNSDIREIAYIFDIANSEQLAIPLNMLNSKDLQSLKIELPKFAQQVQAQQAKINAELQNLQQQISEYSFELQADLKPKSTSLELSLQEKQSTLQEVQTKATTNMANLEIELKKARDASHAEHLICTAYEQTILEIHDKLEQLSESNVQLMDNAEQEYFACAKARQQFLNEYSAKMKSLMADVGQVQQEMEQGDDRINKLKQQLKQLEEQDEE